MRVFLTSLILLFLSLHTEAQSSMFVEKMNVFNIHPNSFYKKDSVKINVHRGNELNSPKLEIIIDLRNISDSIEIFKLNDFQLYMQYRYRKVDYKVDMSSVLLNVTNDTHSIDSLNFDSKEVFKILGSNYIIKQGSSLELKMRKTNDFTDFLLEILPTLSFILVNERTTYLIESSKIQEVNILQKNVAEYYLE